MTIARQFGLRLVTLVTVGMFSGAATPAFAHDANCSTVYQTSATSQPIPSWLADGDFILDDVHQVPSQSVLCAVDVKGKASDYGTLSLLVYQGTSDD